MFDRDFQWKSAGREIKIRDMSDTYLINVIAYVKTNRSMNIPANVQLLDFLINEATGVRKLTREFIEMGPFPFILPDGNWGICDKNRYYIHKLSHKTQRDTVLEFEEDILTEDALSDKCLFEVNEVIKKLKNILKL